MPSANESSAKSHVVPEQKEFSDPGLVVYPVGHAGSAVHVDVASQQVASSVPLRLLKPSLGT